MPPRRDPAAGALATLDRAVNLHGPDAVEALEDGLGSTYAAVVARAAIYVRELEMRGLEDALIQGYHRLAKDPVALDPVCTAMKEIVATLFEFGSEAPAVYLHAARHVQEAGWDRQDAGAPLRGLAIQALAKTEHPEALALAADILVQGLPAPLPRDDALHARIGAARALRAMGVESSALLLRMKVQTGDTSSEVYGECFAAMLEYSASWLDAVAVHLESDNDVIVALAALSIGDARPPGAMTCLAAAWETQTNPDAREAILNAIASLRADEAVDYLVGLVGRDSMTAMQALSALTLYAASEAVVSQVRVAAEANRRKEVASMFQRLFG